jgi:hypothetical protein
MSRESGNLADFAAAVIGNTKWVKLAILGSLCGLKKTELDNLLDALGVVERTE